MKKCFSFSSFGLLSASILLSHFAITDCKAELHVESQVGKDMWGFSKENAARVGAYQELDSSDTFEYGVFFSMPIDTRSNRLRWAGIQLIDEVNGSHVIFGMVGEDFKPDNSKLGIITNSPGLNVIPLEIVVEGKVGIKISSEGRRKLLFSTSEDGKTWEVVYEMELEQNFAPNKVGVIADQYHSAEEGVLPFGPVEFFSFFSQNSSESDDFKSKKLDDKWHLSDASDSKSEGLRGIVKCK